MANFADDQIISTAGGDDNGDFDLDIPVPGEYILTIGGTFGSRSLELLDVDRSGNEFAITDPSGAALSAVTAAISYTVDLSKTLRITMTGTGTALITVTVRRKLS